MFSQLISNANGMWRVPIMLARGTATDPLDCPNGRPRRRPPFGQTPSVGRSGRPCPAACTPCDAASSLPEGKSCISSAPPNIWPVVSRSESESDGLPIPHSCLLWDLVSLVWLFWARILFWAFKKEIPKEMSRFKDNSNDYEVGSLDYDYGYH